MARPGKQIVRWIPLRLPAGDGLWWFSPDLQPGACVPRARVRDDGDPGP